VIEKLALCLFWVITTSKKNEDPIQLVQDCMHISKVQLDFALPLVKLMFQSRPNPDSVASSIFYFFLFFYCYQTINYSIFLKKNKRDENLWSRELLLKIEFKIDSSRALTIFRRDPIFSDVLCSGSVIHVGTYLTLMCRRLRTVKSIISWKNFYLHKSARFFNNTLRRKYLVYHFYSTRKPVIMGIRTNKVIFLLVSTCLLQA